MNRRLFLKRGACMSAAAVLAGCGKAPVMQSDTHTQAASTQSALKKPLVGTHIWVYAKHQPNYDVSNILPKIWADVQYAGIDAVELMEQPLRREDKTNEIAALIDQHNVALIGTSYGANFWNSADTNKIYEDLDNISQNLQTLNARTLGISVGRAPEGRLKTDSEFDVQADLIRRLVKLTDERGIVLNLHNHTYEVENDLHDLSGTLSRIPSVKLGPDLNWLKRAGIDPIWFLKSFKDNIVFMHLRDEYKNGSWSESLGEGDVDFEAIANTLSDIAYTGDIIIELAHEDGFTPTRPIKESLRMSRAMVRQKFKV
ncbi:TIM barrel protein [Glaciecola siphonariae]|uniref:TIM barrel protein n=1 Tax=Glaciecola siphonariae TaxID=521012 RepID=A0ABV9LXH1_9ALTE